MLAQRPENAQTSNSRAALFVVSGYKQYFHLRSLHNCLQK
jgi:hypothetical protein